MNTKPNIKDTMMLRVVFICTMIILIVVALMKLGICCDPLRLDFLTMMENRLLLSYTLIVNLLAFIMFGIDKHKAINDGRRIPIVNLMDVSFAGGTIGAMIGMKVFHHKTKVNYFVIGEPMILFTHMVVLFYFHNLPF